MNSAAENVPQRLADHDIIWLATTRPDGRPHLIAIWFVPVDGALWFATGASSVKVTNLLAEPRVNVSLESGTDPLVGEGSAVVVPHPYPQPVVDAFRRRFDWDIASGDDDQVGALALVRIDIDRWRR